MSKNLSKNMMRITVALLFALMFMFSFNAHADGTVIEVTVGDTTTGYADFGEGWIAAYNSSQSNATTVKLLADWVAPDGKFYCAKDGEEIGTLNGSLYVDSDPGFTIDLNGYKIDRGLTEAVEDGHVIYMNDGALTINDSSEAQTGTITGGHVFYGNGGGIYKDNGILTVNGGNIIGNKATEDPGWDTGGAGGAIYSHADEVIINGGTISDNFAERSGGGIAIRTGKITMNNGVITKNTSYAYAGGIYLEEDAYLFLHNGTFSENDSWNGGALAALVGCYITIYDCDITNNNASGGGGGIYINANARVFMRGGNVDYNTSGRDGGGILIGYDAPDYRPHLEITGGSVSYNTAGRDGGAIDSSHLGDIVLIDCDIVGNKAGANGGGVSSVGLGASPTYYLGGKVNITDNIGKPHSPLNNEDNLYLSYTEVKIYNAKGQEGQREPIPNKPLEEGARVGIGFSPEVILDGEDLSTDDSMFGQECKDCFYSDDLTYMIAFANREDGYVDVYPDNMRYDVEQYAVMSVQTQGNEYKDYYANFELGWIMAYYSSMEVPTTITLYHDMCGYGYFEYLVWNTHEVVSSRNVTKRGCLAIDDSDIDLTIDLNGYNIDRGRESGNPFGSVFYIEAGSLTIKDSKGGGKITGGNAIPKSTDLAAGYGGAFYVDNGSLNIGTCNLTLDGIEVSGNKATRGGAIYWNASGKLTIVDTVITGNEATNHEYDEASGKCGGVYLENWGDLYLGGTTVINGNKNSIGGEDNLRFDSTSVTINHARGQEGVPDRPICDGANIGIGIEDFDDEETVLISDEDSRFDEGSFGYFHADSYRHYVRAVYDPAGDGNKHKLYYNTWGHSEASHPSIVSVSSKAPSVLSDAVYDAENNVVILTAKNNKKATFENVSLDGLITYTFGGYGKYIVDSDYTCNILEKKGYKILSNNGTYLTFRIQVVPDGGTWAQEQDEPEQLFAMAVTSGGKTKTFVSCEDGWVYALKQSEDNTSQVTITLGTDWIASDGKFYCTDENGDEYGTNNGRLYLYYNYKNLIIDLNGFSIDRGLTSPTDNGQVFHIEDQDTNLTIRDSKGGGKITGANNDGNGGAFFVYNGTLTIESGEISGNTATYGAGIYWDSRNVLNLIGGNITGNTAAFSGGGVYATDWGDIYLGGTVNITNNKGFSGTTNSNLYLSASDVYVNQAKGQATGVANCPLKDGANIGISSSAASDSTLLISDSDSRFGMGNFGYFSSDNPNYYVRAVYDEDGGNHANMLYYTSWGTVGYPTISSVSLKNTKLLTNVSIDVNNQVVTLTAKNNLKSSFENMVLDYLIGYTLNEHAVEVVGSDSPRNMLETNSYRVMSSNNTYVTCNVKVVPEGGTWAEVQEPPVSPISMTVTTGGVTTTFFNHNDGWVYGLQQSCDNTNNVTITFYDDWTAPNGSFYCTNADGNEFGTEDGTLYLGENYYNLVIDLNGHTIDRNATYGSRYGQVFYIYDYDLNVTIKDSTGGGKITGGNAHYDGSYGYGGGIYVGRGTLTLDGVEISGNKANYGGGIYWDSDFNLCVVDCTITDNYAYYQGGGIYGTAWGDMYFGGTTVIEGNSCNSSAVNNLYLSDTDVFINNAAGQNGVPKNPLRDGARIGITATADNSIISGENSQFGSGNFGYFFGDVGHTYYVRAVFDEYSATHTHKLFYTPWSHSEARYPRITSVSVRNSNLISAATIDVDKQIITLTAVSADRTPFESVVVESLVSFTVDNSQTYWRFCDVAFDLTEPMNYKVVTKSNQTYVQCKVIVEFPECTEHVDENSDNICDNCGQTIITDFAISSYDAETKTATILIPKAGTYTLVFADYEGGGLENVEFATVTVSKAQKATVSITKDFNLSTNDKIIFFADSDTFAPACEAYTME